MSMKTILVPMEPHEGMGAVLETALLLAKKRGSYIEGFPLRFGISEFVAVDPAGSIPLESYRQESQEEAAQARKLFEAFMQQRGIPQSSGAGGGLSCGWLDDAPEGESFVGSYGRVFDITVLSRPDANTIGLHNRAIESGPVRERPADPVVAAGAAEGDRDQHHDPLELQHRAGPRHGLRHAAAAARSASRCSRCPGGQAVPGPTAEQLLKHLRHNGIAGEADDGRPRRQATPARRSCARQGRGLRSSGEGRLHPKPVAADDLRRRHQPYPGERRTAGADGALALHRARSELGHDVDGASPIASSGSPNGWLTCHGDEQYSSALPQLLEVRAKRNLIDGGVDRLLGPPGGDGDLMMLDRWRDLKAESAGWGQPDFGLDFLLLYDIAMR